MNSEKQLKLKNNLKNIEELTLSANQLKSNFIKNKKNWKMKGYNSNSENKSIFYFKYKI